MHRIIKLFLFTLFISSIHTAAIAQKKNFTFSPTIGLNTPILDNGFGFHIGINPAYSITNYIAIEAQVSYAYVKVKGSFISGEEDSQVNFNALIGGRLYIRSEEKKVRPYINLLAGGMHNQESDFVEFIAGASAGAFLDINQFLIGLSFETPGNYVLKFGYVF